MLGNGFDLFYKLPTKYINFLNTVDYLNSVYKSRPENLTFIHTISDVFGQEQLQQKDKFIADSYQTYRRNYDNVELPFDAVEALAKLPDSNLWFSYLFKTFNKDIGWIDFEKEIGTVIHSFQEFLKSDNPRFTMAKRLESDVDKCIIKEFKFFHHPIDPEHRHDISNMVDDGYVVTYPYGSTNRIINKTKIIGDLEKDLLELSEALKLYLLHFVEGLVSVLTNQQSLDVLPVFDYSSYVVTFNYTNTFERLYQYEKVFHIHGNVNKSIVLGINPDKADETENIDTSFLRFKKYYQRTILESDVEYIKWLIEYQTDPTAIGRSVDTISLLVMGHSLDVTDKDIIEELFGIADDITVLFHNEEAKASMIANLISIFGRKKFFELRKEKSLLFLSQADDFSEYIKHRQSTSQPYLAQYIKSLL